MYLTAIRVTGLKNAADYHASDLDRVVELPVGPAGLAVCDALTMFAAALDRDRCRDFVVLLGLAEKPDDVAVIEEDNFPSQLTVPHARPIAALLPAESGGRQVTVSIDVVLDPPLFGRLRALAVRDPRLVTALGERASVTIKVGWLFTNDLVTASLSVLGIAVGDTTFPLTGSERPTWLPGLLRDVGVRFGRLRSEDAPNLVAGRILEASLSGDPERRARAARVADALAEPPFEVGRLELVRFGAGVEPAFGNDLLRARQFGPTAAEALRLAEAVLLDAPDVLICEAPGISQRSTEDVRNWLSAHTMGDRATLEQVIVAPGGAPPRSGRVA